MEFSDVREWLATQRDSVEHREMIDLAVILREIASRGEAERKLCREVLEAVMSYTKIKDEGSFLSFD